MKDETPAATGAPPYIDGTKLSSDIRMPLWRGHRPATPEKLRRRFELYVLGFENYIEERRAA
jgi:hypothetical protein